MESLPFRADKEDTDQTARVIVLGLTWVFAGRTWKRYIFSRWVHIKVLRCRRVVRKRLNRTWENVHSHCAPNEDSDQPAHQSLRCPHYETLHHWLSKMRPVKILNRLCECAGSSESSLGGRHISKRVFPDVAVRCLSVTSITACLLPFVLPH